MNQPTEAAINPEAAAEVLWQAWTLNEPLAELPADLQPAGVEDAYRVQQAMDRHAGARAGWKLAATGAGARAVLGVQQPLAGQLYSRFALPSGASFDFTPMRMGMIEAEFGLVLGRDLSPQEAPFSREAVLEAIATVVPALEVPDTRYLDVGSVGAAQLTADAACAGFFVLGEPVTGFDLEALPQHEVVLSAPNGSAQGNGANVLDDPVEALRWLANELSANGLRLSSGDLVMTGAAALTRNPGAGPVVGEFGSLGSVELRLS